MYIEYSIGYGYAIITCPLIGLVLYRMSEILGINKNPDKPGEWTAQVVGIVERVLYVSAFLYGFPEFIAVWFGAKVAGNWHKWQKHRREYFQPFLIGNGLSILYSFIGKQMIVWIQSHKVLLSVHVGIGLVVFNMLLWIWLLCMKRENNN